MNLFRTAHGALVVGLLSSACFSHVDASHAADGQKYQLEYKFTAGETVRWEVVHLATISSSIEGTEQTAKTRSESVKVWKIDAVSDDGEISFTHLVESVKMKNQLPQRAVVEYDSQKDASPPAGFADVAKAVGVPLTEVRIDRYGKILAREQKHAQPGNTDDTAIALPLPSEPISVGHLWSEPHEVQVNLPGGKTRSIKTRRRFELKKVEKGVATIACAYQMLTPVQDPAIEAQLIQRLHAGEVKFDIEQGRVVAQQLDIDRRVLGFSGATSSMHYQMKFTERLLGPDERLAERPMPPAGPEKPPAPNRK